MNCYHLTLPSDDQIMLNKLSIIEKHGAFCSGTDLVALTGGSVGNYNDRTTKYWTSTIYRFSSSVCEPIYISDTWAYAFNEFPQNKIPAIRPLLLPFVGMEEVLKKGYRDDLGVLNVNYGSYPQYAVSENENDELEKRYQEGSLVPTGKTYTINKNIGSDTYLELIQMEEYTKLDQRKDEKYIRFCAPRSFPVHLTLGRVIAKGQIYYLKVEPVTWLYDQEANLLLSKKALLSGIMMHNIEVMKSPFFEGSTMNQFLNQYLVKDLFEGMEKEKEKDSFFRSHPELQNYVYMKRKKK